MKQLIINADDYGMSAGVNRGIVELLRSRVISGTSVLTNMVEGAHLAELRAVVRDVGAGVGLHVNLSQGPAVNGPSSLTDSSGCFLERGELVRRARRGKVCVGDIRQEVIAQIGRLAEAGMVPTHFDSHQHVSAIPQVFAVMLELARRYRVSMRPQRHYYVAAAKSSGHVLRRRPLVRAIARTLDASSKLAGVRMARFVVEVDAAGWKTCEEHWKEAIRGLPLGVSEIFVHPGYLDERVSLLSRYAVQRERELLVLKSLVGPLVCDSSVKLVSHRDAFGDRW
jgi:hypothetical protein